MTDREKAIVMAYTGICMLSGDKFQIFHKYVEDIMDRPIFTHEMGLLADEIKEKSEVDFMALCADKSSSENPINCTCTDEEIEKSFISDVEAVKDLLPLPEDAEWIDNKCSNCGKGIEDLIDSREWYENEKPNFCPFCGKKFKESEV